MCLDTETGERRLWEKGELEQFLNEEEAKSQHESMKRLKSYRKITPEISDEEAIAECNGITLDEFYEMRIQEINKIYGITS